MGVAVPATERNSSPARSPAPRLHDLALAAPGAVRNPDYPSVISASLTSPVARQSIARTIAHPAVVLTTMIAASIVARSIIAWRHSIPRLFPDEYIYAALGRSIGHGHLEIRGETAHFPAILEPVLAAPIWRLFPTETAY